MKIEQLYRTIGYKFRDQGLILKALTHPSYVNEVKQKVEHNEVLEFLGDAVIGLAISHLLIKRFPNLREGQLSKLKAAIVSEKNLSNIAKKLGIASMILLGKGEENTGGRRKDSILADTVEAIFGAIYLDAGFDKVLEIVESVFDLDVFLKNFTEDSKSRLQEEIQKRFGTLPKYKVVEEKGPPHNKEFKIALFINNKLIAEGRGKSKKEAEKEAAMEGLKWLGL